MRRLLLLCGLVWLLGSPVIALDFYVAPDVPISLAGVPGGTALPFNTQPDALHLQNNGDWLFSVDSPTTIAGTTYLPYDVVRLDGGGLYSYVFCGGPFGLASGSDVDAVLLAGQRDDGNLIVSFDVPTTIGGITYQPADLVELQFVGPGCGNWLVAGLFFDASTTVPPVPNGVNLTGADERAGMPVLTFDVPATLGPTFMPGEIIAWDVTIPAFVSLHMDPAWSVSVHANALSLLAAPGRIPCLPPNKLEIDKGPGLGQITLFWSNSCSVGSEDYGIYEGTIGIWYSHTAIDCADGGTLLEEVVNYGLGDQYYLVVPHNPNDEGSYGLKSVPPLAPPAERPAGFATCQPSREFGCP
jgi:hypothetical protein